mmetsp:Transcript_34343/g.87374  ORF Transcript_34343/g.87374 Transcript_34343/m.87374 type:complete len:269 (+) Transcript_34343:225-1031(+)
MPFALLDATARREVEDVEPRILGTGNDVSAAGRDLDTAQAQHGAWGALDASSRVGIVDVPEKDLPIEGAAHHLLIPVLALRQAGDVAVLREVLHQRLVQFQVVSHNELVLGAGVHVVRHCLVDEQVCHRFPVVGESGQELPRCPMPETHSAIIATGDDEVWGFPDNSDATSVRLEFPQWSRTAPPLHGPGSELTVVIPGQDLPGRHCQDHASGRRLTGCRHDRHVVREVQQENLAGLGRGADTVARGAKRHRGDLICVRSSLQGRCQV